MNRRRKVFERVVNPLISKYMIDPFKYNAVVVFKYQLNILNILKKLQNIKMP